MPRKLGPDTDVEIGTLPDQGQGGSPTPPKNSLNDEDWTTPGSEQDKGKLVNDSVLGASVSDLDEHRNSAELDHPQGSIKAKHLDNSIRAVLETLNFNDDGILEALTSTKFQSNVEIVGALDGKVFSTLVAKTADYTITDDDGDYVEADSSSVDIAFTVTLTLPTAADNDGRTIMVCHVDGGGSVFLDGEGSEQVNGATTFELPDKGSVVAFRCNGTSWTWVGGHILGSNSNGNYVVFSSGLQVCWNEAKVLPDLTGANTSDLWALPQAFANTDYFYTCQVTNPSYGSYLHVQPWPASYKSTSICAIRSEGDVSTKPLAVYAIGEAG